MYGAPSRVLTNAIRPSPAGTVGTGTDGVPARAIGAVGRSHDVIPATTTSAGIVFQTAQRNRPARTESPRRAVAFSLRLFNGFRQATAVAEPRCGPQTSGSPPPLDQ